MADACRALTRGLIALAFLSFSPLATPGLAQQDQAQPAATDAEQRPAAGQRGNQKNPTAEPSSGTSERGRGQSFPPGTGGPVQNFPSVGEQHRLPPDSTTKQTITVRGRALNFSATAGSIRLFNGKGEPEADVAYTAYQLDGTEPASRPVTFFLNGGPGASSAWLQVGAAGPWRLNFENSVTTAAVSPELRPNPETWLDFTDLVFIDPVGTGYSRFVATGDDARKALFSIDGDVTELSLVIRRWLEKAGRLMSPKFVVGESYSGIRGPKIVRNLANQQGVGIRGLILVSPALDFRETSGSSLLQYVASLPTMAAVARAAKGPVTRADMADVEHYAAQEFLLDLVKGQADVEATTRLADKFATLTGIDQAVSRRLAGRLDVSEFRRELDRRDGRVTGRYDGTITGFDPSPDSSFYQFEDPSLEPLLAPVTSAVVDLTTRKLNWRPDGSYEVLSGAVNRAWDFGRGLSPAESTTQLRQILAADSKFKLLVAHGLFDLATPYFGSQIQLDQLPAYATPDRVKLVVYPGGHMFYSRDASRKALRDEAEAMMK